ADRIAWLRSLEPGRPARRWRILPNQRGQASRIHFYDCPSRRRSANVLRGPAVERDRRVDAHADRHVEPARHGLHGRDLWILPTGSESAVERAAVDAAEARA